MNKSALRWILTFIAISGVFTLDVYLPGVTYAAQSLSVSPGEINLTFTAFSIVFACSQLVWGPLSDCYGRKPILITGLSLAIICTLLCALAVSYWQLLVFRMLQALGTSCFVVLNAIVRDIYDGEVATRYRAYLTAISGLTISIAPSFGSLAVSILGWKGTFLASAIVLILTLILVIAYYFETCPRKVVNTRTIIDSYYQLIGARPVFILHSIQAALAYAVHFCYVILSPFIIIHLLHFNIEAYSIVMFIYGLSWLASGMLTSNLAKRMSNNKLINMGCVILLTGSLCLISLLSLNALNIISLMTSVLIMVIGAMMVRPTAITLALSSIPEFSGQGAGIINLLQFTIAGLAASIVSAFDSRAIQIIGLFAIIVVAAVISIQYLLKHIQLRKQNILIQ